MTREEIKAELDAAKKQMEGLLQDKILLDLKVGQLSQTINTLIALLQPKPDPADISDVSGLLFEDSSITGAIRVVLLRSPVPMSPTQIRSELVKSGFDLSEYENEMAVIHNTLKRLDKQGELMTVKDSSGQTVAYTTRFQTQGFVPLNVPATEIKQVSSLPADHPVRKLAEGARFPKRK